MVSGINNKSVIPDQPSYWIKRSNTNELYDADETYWPTTHTLLLASVSLCDIYIYLYITVIRYVCRFMWRRFVSL